MKKIRAAVVGYGNIGRYALEALEAANDFEVAGIVRRHGAENKPAELEQYEVVKDIRELKDVDVAILATPSRSCEEYAKQILPLGINTVDSFDYRRLSPHLAAHLQGARGSGCHCCRMGSGIRQHRAQPDAEPCTQGLELHQLRSRHVDGPQRVRAL